MEEPTALCEFCKKSLTEATILKHIGNSNQCKLHYGSRFSEMKKRKSNEKVQNWRKNNKEKELESQRKLYAKQPENKEKKRQYYEEKQTKLAKAEGWHYTQIMKTGNETLNKMMKM